MAKSTRKSYLRERVRLTAEHPRRALAMIEGKRLPARIVEWADEKAPGLVLRATSTAATYLLKLHSKTLRIGDAAVLTVEQARMAAQSSAYLVKHAASPRDTARGGSIRHKLDVFQSVVSQGTTDVETAWEVAEFAPIEGEALPDEERIRLGPWLWRDAVAQFLAWKVRKARPNYFADVESSLRNPAFEQIADIPIANLDIGHLEQVRNAIQETNAASTVSRSVERMKAVLTWAWSNHSGVCRFKDVPYPWWERRLNFEYSSGKREHVPTIVELVRTLVLAETVRARGKNSRATATSTLVALWATVLTGQRTGPLMALSRAKLVPADDPQLAGWMIASWTGDEMKGGRGGGRPHSLPLPPAVVAILERWWKKADDSIGPSPFCFPSERGDAHVNQSAVNQLLYRLEGRVKTPGRREAAAPEGKRRSRPSEGVKRENLLARHGIRPWIPHDVRRALSTHLDDLRLGGSASAILAHKPTFKEDDRERTEDVTRQHYTKSQRIGLKAEGMAVWVDAILQAYKSEKAAFDPAQFESRSGEKVAA